MESKYYIPHGSYWPFIGSVAVFMMVFGFASALHDNSLGTMMSVAGLGLLFFMLFGWFGTVVDESQKGIYNAQVDRSFRMGMGWFIFSEVMFFAAFFGALFYVRILSVPWLGGEGSDLLTNPILWPDFKSMWPLINTPGDVLQSGVEIAKPTHLVDAWHIPALNTAILLTSGVTITWAHHALKANNRKQLVLAMVLTVLLGVTFLGFQIQEYGDAYGDNLKLTSGAYGSTFYMLTGFHGFHVTLGTIMLIVILMRCIRGHFSEENHFAFEAVAWYWHFVDVVWLGLFIFVYWL